MEINIYNELMRQYIDEANDIKESYDNAKETLYKQHEKALKRFNEIQSQFQEFEIAYKIGEVDEEEFIEAQKEYQRVENTVVETGYRLDEIEHFKKELLMSVLAKQNDLRQTYKKELAEETEKLRLQLMKAKYEFLKLAVELRKTYNKLSYEEYYHEKLKKDLGLPSEVKELNAFQALAPAILDEGAGISFRELTHALYFGMLPEELRMAIEEKEK
jgi:hypothetical protein